MIMLHVLFDKSKVESREANFALLNNAIHEIKNKGTINISFRLKTGIKIKHQIQIKN